MPRYSLYEGVRGHLCAHPMPQPGSRRHPGMKRRPLADGEAFEALVDLYDPLPEIYEVHRCLEKACASGALRRVKGPIVARDMAEAIKKLRPEAKPTLKAKSPKGGE